MDDQSPESNHPPLVASESVPVPVQASAPSTVPCESCNAPTPGGICDGCIEGAHSVGLDLGEMLAAKRRRAREGWFG